MAIDEPKFQKQMIQTVVKRDGRVAGYNEEKIKAAIRKAMLTTEMGEDEALIQKITDRVGMSGKERMTVEEIQDRVDRTHEIRPQGCCQKIHRIPRPAQHSPAGKDSRHVS